MTKLLLSCACVVLVTGSLFAERVYIEDGLLHTIDNVRYEGHTVWVDYNMNNDPGTSLRVMPGGEIAACVYAYHNSSVHLDGGIIGGLLFMYGDSTAVIDSGTVGYGFTAFGNSVIDFNGGVVNDAVNAADNGTINIYGGFMEGVWAEKHGVANLRGGTVATFLRTLESGTIYVDGSGFEVITPGGTQPLAYGDRLSDFGILAQNSWGDYLTGTLSGTLADGIGINAQFDIYADSDIVIVPEPINLLILALGAVGMHGSRRKPRS